MRYRSGSHNLKSLSMTKDILIALNIQMGIKTMAMAGGIQENLKRVIMVVIKKQYSLSGWTGFLFPYTPIQEVMPKVVAIAVNTVMTMFRILPQSDLLSIV